MSLETANGPVGSVMKFCTIVKFMYAGKLFRNFAKNVPLHIPSSFISTSSGRRINMIFATLDPACNSTHNTQKKHGPKFAISPNFCIKFQHLSDVVGDWKWSCWICLVILHKFEFIYDGKTDREIYCDTYRKIYRNIDRKTIDSNPSVSTRFQFNKLALTRIAVSLLVCFVVRALSLPK